MGLDFFCFFPHTTKKREKGNVGKYTNMSARNESTPRDMYIYIYRLRDECGGPRVRSRSPLSLSHLHGTIPQHGGAPPSDRRRPLPSPYSSSSSSRAVARRRRRPPMMIPLRRGRRRRGPPDSASDPHRALAVVTPLPRRGGVSSSSSSPPRREMRRIGRSDAILGAATPIH